MPMPFFLPHIAEKLTQLMVPPDGPPEDNNDTNNVKERAEKKKKTKTDPKTTKPKTKAKNSLPAPKKSFNKPAVHIKEDALDLRADNIKKRYGKRMVVQGVSFHIRQGEVVGLLGPNGAGKTTSFYMVVGLVKPTDGSIFLGDRNITGDAMYKRARAGIGYLAQEASIFRKLTVRQNVEAILQIQKLSKKEIEQKTDRLLSELEITHVQHQNGITLSGGERRRAEIARCLASDPKFILLDEPFAGVDPIAVKEIQKVVSHLQERNLGILITDHNVRETLKITDRAYIMFQGQVLKEGTSDELINDPKAREIYLGDDFQI